MARAETGLDEVKRSRDYYRKEIEEQERKLVSLREQIDAITDKLPRKQKVLDELNEIIDRLEAN